MDMHRYRVLGWAAYGVAFLLVAFPVMDSVLGVWPLRPGQVTWRFGAMGLFSRAVMTPTLGLLLAVVTATVFRQRTALRFFAVLGFLGSFLALAALGLFVVDASQTRTQVVADAAAAFNTASALAALKYGLGAALCALLGWGGWSAARGVEEGARRSGRGAENRRAEGMIVGTPRS